MPTLIPFPDFDGVDATAAATTTAPATKQATKQATTRPRLEIWGCDLYARETFSLFVDDECAEFDDAMNVSRYSLAELENDPSAQATIDARLGAGSAARALAHLRGG